MLRPQIIADNVHGVHNVHAGCNDITCITKFCFCCPFRHKLKKAYVVIYSKQHTCRVAFVLVK